MIKRKILTRNDAMYFQIPQNKILNIIVNWKDEDWVTHENVFNVDSFDTSRIWGRYYLDVVKSDGKIKSFEWNCIINIEYYLSDAENEMGECVGVWNF